VRRTGFQRWIGTACLVFGIGVWAGCDSGITGDAFDNLAPNTSLSVRDSSLVENLAPRRLTSTVFVSWSGTDPDGFVSRFEIRFFPITEQGGVQPEEGWTSTTSLDSLILLPIEEGNETADVVFEVRAVDNEALKDPSPARTVFPIVNSPPKIRFNGFELPPANTFSIVSFSWKAEDPEGPDNLAAIEVSFNDTTSFVALPPETQFATFVGDLDSPDRNGNVVPARVHIGRGFQTTNIFVPGMKMDDDNVFSIRAVDKTDTTSTRLDYELFIWEPKADILFVNDFRKSNNQITEDFHIELLSSYMPEGTAIDIWDLSEPFASGAAGDRSRSDNLPPVFDPSIRQFLALYDHMYWVATSTTSLPTANNFPPVASVMDIFFENGGTMMMHSPIDLPASEDDVNSNPAVLVLPLTGFVEFPDSLRPSLRLKGSATIDQTGAIDLPQLSPARLMIGTLPYVATGSDVALYTAEYTARPFSGAARPWTGPSTVASISSDNRIALMALPLLDERNGMPLLVGADGSGEAARQAMFTLLARLGFPKR